MCQTRQDVFQKYLNVENQSNANLELKETQETACVQTPLPLRKNP